MSQSALSRESAVTTVLFPAAPGPQLPALADSKWLRTFTLCALYFAQGVPTGFVTIALLAILSERGATATQTAGLVTLAFLPWSLKLIWGPTIDRFRARIYGNRRPWIIFAQLMMAGTLLVSVASWDLDSTSTITALGILFFVHNCFASLQDVATDGLAVDLLADNESGRVNGFMWGSKMMGLSVGGAGMASVAARGGLELAMQVQAAIILVIMLLPILVLERRGEKRFPWSRVSPQTAAPRRTERTTMLGLGTNLLRAFTLRATIAGLIVALLIALADSFALPVAAEVFTQQIGWSAEQYAHAQGLWGTIGKLVGAVAGGLLCDRLGRRCVLLTGMLLGSVSYLAFAATSPWWTVDGYPFMLYFLLTDLGLTAAGVAFLAMMMNLSWTMAAATQFTLYMTVSNIGGVIAPQFTRLGLDYVGAYTLCGVLALLPLLALPFVRERAVADRKLLETAHA